MKNSIITLLASLLILFLASCEAEEIDRGGIPNLRTLSVSDNNQEGVTMNADLFFRGEGRILEYGFVWIRNEDPNIENGFMVSEFGNIDGGKFSLRSNSYLRDNIRYNVRAFVRTNAIIAYGDIKEFTSNGTSIPVIQSYSPTTGSWQDSLYIKGKFETYSRAYKIYLGEIELVRISQSDSLLVYKIPSRKNERIATLRLFFDSRNFAAAESFTYVTPEITSLSANVVSPGDTLTVYGEGIIPGNSFVRIGTPFAWMTTPIIDFGENQLRIVVPESKEIEINLILFTNGFEDSVPLRYIE